MTLNIDTLTSLPNFYLPTLGWQCQFIAFYDQNLDFNLLDVHTGARRTLTVGGAVPDRPLPFVWSRDDRYLYFSRSERGDELYDVMRLDTTDGSLTTIRALPDVADYVVDALGQHLLLATTEGTGILGLAAYNLEANTVQHLARFKESVHDAMFSSDGKYVLFAANDTTSRRNVDVWVMRSNGKRQEVLLSSNHDSQDGWTDWVGRRIAVHSDASGLRKAGLLDFRTQELRWLSPDDGHYWPGRISPDGKHLLAYLNRDAAIEPVLLNTRTGKRVQVKLPEGMAYGGQWLDNDEFVLMTETDITRPQIVSYNLQTKTSRTVLAADYGDVDPTVFVPHRYVHYRSFDGTRIPALFYVPPTANDFAVPGIIYLHGGPTAQFHREFDVMAQVLVNAGFAVLMPNVRGSTGYSAEFRDAIVMDWGGVDLQDVAAAAEYLDEQIEVDTGCIGVVGGSYGGFLALLAVSKYPGWFLSGVAINGISDLLRLDADTDPRYQQVLRRYMGDPDQYAALWRDRSAVHFAEQVQAPLLLLHGEDDPRCPLSQAELMRDAMVAAGKVEGDEVVLKIMTDAGHGTLNINQLAPMIRDVRDWFRRTLGAN